MRLNRLVLAGIPQLVVFLHQMLTKLNYAVSESLFGRCLRILEPASKRKIAFFSAAQVMANLLDLIGVALVGILGALAVSGVGAQNPGSRILSTLDFLGLSNQTIQMQVSVIGTAIALILIARTLFSILLLRKTLFFLSTCGSKISGDLASKFFDQPITFVRSKSRQETVFALTRGVDAITVGVLGTSIAVLSDASLLIILTMSLLVVDYVVAIGTFLMFAGFAWIIYSLLNTRSEKLGRENTKFGIQVSSKIIETTGTYRELLVHNRRAFYVFEIKSLREKIARSYSELAFLPSISKYSIEVIMVIATLGLSAAQFYTTDAAHAVGKLAIFIAATSRIAPAALRIQQGALQLRSSTASAEITLDLINELKNQKVKRQDEAIPNFQHPGFEADIAVREMGFSYHPGEQRTLSNVNFEIHKGEVLALVGPSGAGKTTLIDLILGAIVPTSGEIKISNMAPLDAISRWPGAISYVPQETFIIDGTIRENITLGYESAQFSDSQIELSLQKAQLEAFISTLPEGLSTQVGEQGTRLSGGQKQRLGIARALVTNPKLLVLDEATSALDAETENLMSLAIQQLKGQVSVIIVAHRLSTVKNADQLVYLDNGVIRAKGIFEELRNLIPEFDNQSKLLGL